MVIIKIGGGKNINIEAIAKNINRLSGPKIIVHGANYFRDELAEKLGIQKKVVTSVSGYSSVFSDDSLIDLQLMAYAGLRNKRIVELLNSNGLNAIGLTGMDGRLIVGKRNKGIRVRENGKLKIIRDNSGKPKEVNKELLNSFIEHNLLPVLTVPIADENGKAINSENDDIVALLNEAFKPEMIVQFIEAPGLLEDANNEDSLITSLTKNDLILWEEKAEGRIKRKIHALNKLFVSNSPKVMIADGRAENPIDLVLNNRGTIIQ